uniref:Uncharacterized protein n=1 Tax=Phenylobacterium glaciei TaxID=2803784 RepID=A0A974P0U6_9CAUL|nr:hypothetical protein JKL49_18195 [Phenylobacterium glaciei]
MPVSLSTDDAGILRIDLSHEYARAADEGATYADLKASARNAIAFSFLAGRGCGMTRSLSPSGQGLRRPGRQGRAKPGACADLIAASDKAREQWRHERLVAAFEAGAR